MVALQSSGTQAPIILLLSLLLCCVLPMGQGGFPRSSHLICVPVNRSFLKEHDVTGTLGSRYIPLIRTWLEESPETGVGTAMFCQVDMTNTIFMPDDEAKYFLLRLRTIRYECGRGTWWGEGGKADELLMWAGLALDSTTAPHLRLPLYQNGHG